VIDLQPATSFRTKLVTLCFGVLDQLMSFMPSAPSILFTKQFCSDEDAIFLIVFILSRVILFYKYSRVLIVRDKQTSRPSAPTLRILLARLAISPQGRMSAYMDKDAAFSSKATINCAQNPICRTSVAALRTGYMEDMEIKAIFSDAFYSSSRRFGSKRHKLISMIVLVAYLVRLESCGHQSLPLVAIQIC
jgi:hypothetical protein